jgi:hypothetical protein
MARTSTSLATKTVSSKPKKITGKNKTVTKTSSVAELSEIAGYTKQLEDKERAKVGGQNNFITLVSPTSQILQAKSPLHIAGVKALDYIIKANKLVVSKNSVMDATVLGIFKVYAETKRKEAKGELTPTLSFWMPDDAVQYPVGRSNFERELPNGNILTSQHWVFLYLHDHPEIDNCLYSFSSKGNSICTKLMKQLKAESSVCTELRFNISNFSEYNDTYKTTNYYPEFEVSGHNYKLVDNQVTKTKDSKVDMETLKEILIRSKKLHDAYSQMQMISKHATLLPAPAGGQAVEYEDDEDENVSF